MISWIPVELISLESYQEDDQLRIILHPDRSTRGLVANLVIGGTMAIGVKAVARSRSQSSTDCVKSGVKEILY